MPPRQRKPAVPPKRATGPKTETHALTVTERIALTALLQAEQNAQAAYDNIQREKASFVAELEKRCRLSAGALQDTHQLNVNGDQWAVVPKELGDSNG